MKFPEPEKTLLIIIDMQEKFLPAIPDMLPVSARIQVLVRGFDALQARILCTEQYPQGLGRTLPEIRGILPQNTPVFDKKAFSILGDDAILQAVRQTNVDTLIFTGVESHVCVMQSAIDAESLGFHSIVAADAVASRHNIDRDSAIAQLRADNIPVLSSESILFMMLRSSAHPSFRTISKIIR